MIIDTSDINLLNENGDINDSLINYIRQLYNNDDDDADRNKYLKYKNKYLYMRQQI